MLEIFEHIAFIGILAPILGPMAIYTGYKENDRTLLKDGAQLTVCSPIAIPLGFISLIVYFPCKMYKEYKK